MSSAQECAEALAAHLSAASLSFNPTIETPEDVNTERESLQTLLQVLPFSESEVKAGRGACVQETFLVSVVLSVRVNKTFNRSDMMPWIKELKEAIRFNNMAGCTWTGTTTEVLWDDEISHAQDALATLLRPAYDKMTR